MQPKGQLTSYELLTEVRIVVASWPMVTRIVVVTTRWMLDRGNFRSLYLDADAAV